ncbi:RHS repeat domain-containing protein [Chitinophaga niabensis]|uniref:YD repeat-containing protein n=1 Tax=Chitinophaga niabensis TaxID=536979 RepID=A0A1N6FXH8_9BACT|nr:hypothetical protein [Chitinophaga niabensis]SIN99984.1 YD repeat-containing protein [Chitinophaga niabensis]
MGILRTFISAASLLLVISSAQAQYYYQDVYITQQTAATMALFKSNKVSFQHVKTLDANQEEDRNFICIRGMNPTHRQMRTLTQSSVSGRSVVVSTFNNAGKLTKSVDSVENSISTMQYQYTQDGRLEEIQTGSRGREDKFTMTENRRYVYDTLGRLKAMILKKGGLDSTVVKFTTDAEGRVTEEAQPGRQRVYYNYDSKGRLTDVLRFHPTRKKMLPDYSFEYDANGKLTQMTVVNIQSGDYLIWKYSYDAKGLPQAEECSGKEKTTLGMVRYTYEYFQ